MRKIDILHAMTVAGACFVGLATSPALAHEGHPHAVRINCGGGEYVDAAGETWSADAYFRGGGSYFRSALEIGGTVDDPLYLTERFGSATYAVPVPDGDYVVLLRFAEIYWYLPGQRLFDVNVEGTDVALGLDIVGEAGALHAYDLIHETSVDDGFLTIQLTTIRDNAKLSAIEIVPASTGTATSPRLALTPATLDFGLVNVTTDSSPATVTLTNTGNALLTVSQLGVRGIDADTFTANAASTYLIAAGSSRTVPITFAPAAAADHEAEFFVVSDSDQGEAVVDLRGTGVVAGTPRMAVTPAALDFGTVRLGLSSNESIVRVDSTGDVSLEIGSVTIEGPDAATFAFAGTWPQTLPAGSSTTYSVLFTPDGARPHAATLRVSGTGGDALVALTGDGSLAPATEFRINAGGGAYTGADGAQWTADEGASGGATYTNAVPIAGTTDDALYQTERFGNFAYALATGNGSFDVTLHFAEIYWATPGSRVFDVTIEGVTVADDLDLFAVAGHRTAYRLTRTVDVQDDVLSISLATGVDNAKLSAIEVAQTSAGPGPGLLTVSPDDVTFATTAPGQSSAAVTLTLANVGASEIDVTDVRVEGAHALDFVLVDSAPPYALAAGGSVTLSALFAPQAEGARSATLRLVNSGPAGDVVVALRGTADADLGHGYMHAVAGPPQVVTDDDRDGFETVTLNGASSHTHELGESLVSHVWREGGAIVATGITPEVAFATGLHSITLTITDSSGKSHEATTTVDVVDPSDVPGLLAYYYEGLTAPVALPDFSGLVPTYGEVVGVVHVPSNSTALGGVPSIANVGARYIGALEAPVAGSYVFEIESDDGSELLVDGVPVILNDGLHAMRKQQGTVQLTAGRHDIELRYFQAAGGLGVILRWQPPGGTLEVVPASVLSHGELGVAPVLAAVTPDRSAPQGGELIEIRGLGFFDGPVTVRLGTRTIDEASLVTREFDRLTFLSPPGLGDVALSVTTSVGSTRILSFLYGDEVPPPVQFDIADLAALTQPTTLAFGPDGRLYVGSVTGMITAYTLGPDGSAIATQQIPAVQALGQGRVILGLAFDPTDTSGQPALLVAHSKIFDPSQLYAGKVSRLRGPSFSVLEDLVTGLPVSDHDHATNGLEFGPLGELLIAQGGNTNAGVPHQSLGMRDESVLSGAILVAHLERPGFDGFVTYDQTINPSTANQTGGLDVGVFSPGHRNAFDLVVHSNGNIYATDNGPNLGFGGASLDCALVGAEPYTPDELNLVREDEYYGHPNHNRGRSDARQCVFRDATGASGAGYTQPMAIIPSSSNGICEYTAATFGGQMRGDLLIVQFNQVLRRYRLTPDGEGVAEVEVLGPGGLDVTQGPDGSIYVADFTGNRVVRYGPVEPAPTDFAFRDVFPNRGPVAGGTEVRVTGRGFGSAAGTSVTIDGSPMLISSVTATAIVGVLPPGASAGGVDVVVTTAGVTRVLPAGFRYVGVSTGVSAGSWTRGPDLLEAVEETSVAAIGNEVFVLGGGQSASTVQIYDALAGSWRYGPPLPASFQGSDHVNVAVVDGKLYAMGGLAPPSSAVHVLDPSTGVWSTRGPIRRGGQPFAIGSSSVAVLGTDVYLIGGLLDETEPTGISLVYDSVADSWSEIPAMPTALNHAAGIGAYGKVWVFGGRPGVDFPAPGSDLVQVYDPATGVWDTTTYRLPVARAGTGPAVQVNGRLIVMGGEGGGPVNGLFPDVDELDPVTNTWRKLADMPTPRHGTMPVIAAGRVQVAGGGVVQGFSASTVLETYHPAGSSDIASPSVLIAEAQGGSYEHAPTLTLTVADDALLESVSYRFDDGPSIALLASIGQPSVVAHVFVPDDDAFHDLTDGAHTVRIEALDAVGNLGVLSWSFVKGAPPPLAVRVNCGGLQYVDGLGQSWFADQGFLGGATYSVSGEIAGTDDDPLYRSERYGNFTYEFAVPPGRYMVHLYFAEIYGGITTSGQRVFGIEAEGTAFVQDLDVLAEVGPRAALERSFYVDVTDGFLTLRSLPGVQNPKLSALRFHAAAPDPGGE